jgi:hypothetical protein
MDAMNNYEEQILELKRRIEVLEKAENKRIQKRQQSRSRRNSPNY